VLRVKSRGPEHGFNLLLQFIALGLVNRQRLSVVYVHNRQWLARDNGGGSHARLPHLKCLFVLPMELRLAPHRHPTLMGPIGNLESGT
jgi:hypothetical protein